MMAENDNKPDNKAKNMPDMEQPVMDPKTETQIETNTAAPRKKRRLGPWLFLLLIFVGLPAVWLLAPAEVRQQTMDMFNAGKDALQAKQVTPSTSPAMMDAQPQTNETDTASAQANDTTSNTEDSNADAAATSPVVESGAPVDMAEPNSVEPIPQEADNSASLQEEINRLQSELNTLQTEHEQLIQQLKSGKTDGLRVRLSLLASPDTRLTQRADIWGELASLSSLHESEQSKAREMSTLLEGNRTQLASVGKALRHLAESIPAEQQLDILPKPENPYLAWLIGAFHLRPAPGKTEQKTSGLRVQLLDMEHALSLDDWPEPHKWRQLLSALSEQFGDDAELGLPESLRDITGDIDTTRAAATAWMEAL